MGQLLWNRELFLALSLLFPLELRAAPVPPRAPLTLPKNVRVLVGQFRTFTISGVDISWRSGKLAGSSTFNVRCADNQIQFGAGESAGGRLDLSSPNGFLDLNGRPYRDQLTIYAKGNFCSVVNSVGLEKYLAGLINREMVPSWPLESLKAQAVASRSYAIFQTITSKNSEYDLESTTMDQVYGGAESETPKSNRAVAETRGQVLAFGSQTVKAYFHANCGGMTEIPEFVWGERREHFRPVVCPYHKKERYRMHWSVHLTRPQIENALKKISGLLPDGFVRLAKLESGAPNAHQRLSDVVVSDSGGNNLIISSNAFRNAIGNTKVKSTAFSVQEDGRGYRIAGEGYGHGVGMCQVGARAMADEGKTYRQILHYYYPLAKIRSL